MSTPRGRTRKSSPRNRVTSSDVAHHAGVSRATVSYVLNGDPRQSIPEETRQKVLAAANELGYLPHTAAQTLVRGKSKLVLLLLPELPAHNLIHDIVEPATQILDAAGYTLITCTPRHESETRPLWQILGPDVVLSIYPLSLEQKESIRLSGVEQVFEWATSQGSQQVLTSSALQVQHLHQLGHRNLVFAGPQDPRLQDLAAHRYHTAAEHARHLSLDNLPLIHLPLEVKAAEPEVQKWVQQGITGVVAYNDEIAQTVVCAALRCGLRVPEDLSVIGHDNTRWGQMGVVTLTSVDIHPHGLGRHLAHMALHLVGKQKPPPPSNLQATVVQRESTGPNMQ